VTDRPARPSLRRPVGALAALLAATLVLTACLGPDGQRAFDLVNHERTTRGIAALENDLVLNAKAQAWAEVLAGRRTLSHSSLSDGVPAGWVRLTENVGRGGSADAVHAGLMGSPSHRANVLDRRVSRVGLGAARASDGALYVVQVFSG